MTDLECLDEYNDLWSLIETHYRFRIDPSKYFDDILLHWFLFSDVIWFLARFFKEILWYYIESGTPHSIHRFEKILSSVALIPRA